MQFITDPEAPTLFDPWHYLGPKRRRMLNHSWAGLFQKNLLKELPVERIASRFHPSFGRPSKELHTMLGVMVLKQMLDLTDAETVEALAYDVRWHYALNQGGETDAEKYVSGRARAAIVGLEGALQHLFYLWVTRKRTGVESGTYQLSGLQS